MVSNLDYPNTKALACLEKLRNGLRAIRAASTVHSETAVAVRQPPSQGIAASRKGPLKTTPRKEKSEQ